MTGPVSDPPAVDSPAGHPTAVDPLAVAVATACRVLAADGQDHFCFGHVSARTPDGGMLVKAAGVSLARVGPEHVAAVAPDGRSVTPGLRLHEETALHRGIYDRRADVGAVVHTHPLAAQTATLFPPVNGGVFSQDEIPFAAGIAWFDEADLVADVGRARALARGLGGARAVLLRAHGLVTVGTDVAEACVLALLLHRALAVRLAAMAVGRPRPMDPATVTRLSAAFEAGHRGRVAAIWADAVAGLRPASPIAGPGSSPGWGPVGGDGAAGADGGPSAGPLGRRRAGWNGS